MRIQSYWSTKIFREAGWYSVYSAFRFLEKLPAESFANNNLLSKEEFISKLKLLVESIEYTGESLKDAREMFVPGSIAENWFPNPSKSLRTGYIEERKKLKEQLAIINVLFRESKSTKKRK